jgi:hypothetical protein
MAPQNQNPAQPPDDTPLKTDIVSNIPLHQAALVPGPVPIKDADNIDGIMKDVTHQLKKEDVRPPKHHWFSHDSNTPKHVSAAPAPHHPVAPAPPSPTAGPVPRQPAPAATKPGPLAPKRSAPVMVVIYTVIITGFLIAAALSAYKK